MRGDRGRRRAGPSRLPLALGVALLAAAAPATRPDGGLARAAAPAQVEAVTPAAGPTAGGTKVTILGVGFIDALAVAFGTSPALTFRVVADGEVIAVSPPGTGTVDVTVTTPGGTSARGPADRFTYSAVPSVAEVLPAAGPTAGAASVLILGSGFSAATGVQFGGLPAQFTVERDDEIVATVPAAGWPGTVDVSVSTPAGSSATVRGDRFTYLVAPVVTEVSPTDGPAAGGTEVTVAGEGLQGAVQVLFGGVPAPAFRVDSDSQVTAQSPPGSGTVTVTVVKAAPPQRIAAGPDGGYLVAGDGSAWTWGAGPAGGSSIPAPGGCAACLVAFRPLTGLPPLRALAAGSATTYALAQDGTVWAWGAGGAGQLGVPPVGYRSAPQPVPGLTQAVAIAAGGGTAYALRVDGSVWAWGADAFGQAGRAASRSCLCAWRPGPVAGLANVVALAAGADTAYALEADGSVWAWGAGAEGQLGSGRLAVRSRPVRVAGIGPAVAVAAGAASGYALAADGSVWAWGAGRAGQLGNGGLSDSAAPVRVEGVTEARALAAAGDSAYAMGADGTLWAWGADGEGQLGPAASPRPACACSPTPVAVPGLAGVRQLAAGPADGYVLENDGSVWAWGAGERGQLGDPAAKGGSASPVQVPGPWSGASSAGSQAEYTYLAAPSVAAVVPSGGPAAGGTAVTITGRGFTGAQAVSFGQAWARSFEVVSDTQILATAPAGQGTVDVTVTTTGGSSAATPRDRFTYTSAGGG